MEEAKRLSTLVPRTLHLVSHIYHNLSDLSVNIAAPPPRQIVAPPMRRQATAIFQQSIPVLQVCFCCTTNALLFIAAAAETILCHRNFSLISVTLRHLLSDIKRDFDASPPRFL